MTIRGLFAGFTLVAALAFSHAAALAQLPPGRSGFTSDRAATNREAWDGLRYFGRCVAHGSPGAAFQLLATEPGSAEEVNVFNRLFTTRDVECLDNMSSMSAAVRLVRGTIAEGLVSLGTPVPPQLVLYAPAPGAPMRTMNEVARCYVASHRAETRALLSGTRPASMEELTALRQMEADVRRCVPPEAASVRFQPTELRYKLAEALWRLPPEAAAPAHP
jgi:hypothetical protein